MNSCILSPKAETDYDALCERFPRMAALVEQALERLPEAGGPEGTVEEVAGSPGMWKREVVNPEAKELFKDVPRQEPSGEVAPNYCIYFQLYSWAERIYHRGVRCVVTEIVSASEAGDQNSEEWRPPTG
jgi:hypothetical protein